MRKDVFSHTPNRRKAVLTREKSAKRMERSTGPGPLSIFGIRFGLLLRGRALTRSRKATELRDYSKSGGPNSLRPKGNQGKCCRRTKKAVLVACGSEALTITELQREGGRRVTAQEFVAGGNIRAGDMLG